MFKASFFLIFTVVFLLSGTTEGQSKEFTWPGGPKLAISLSYYDALDSQLDNAIPILDKYNFKASFYLLPNSPSINLRMEEWRALAVSGHELGNHSMYHPCRASLPDRDWVSEHRDLDKYSVAQMVEEVSTANTFLKAIDGKTERTYAMPCGDLLVGGEEYLSKINHLFVAVKGQGSEESFSLHWVPTEVTGKELIDYIKNVPDEISSLDIISHGVGGDYLSVSSEAHEELLDFLDDNRDKYYVDSYINIMKLLEE